MICGILYLIYEKTLTSECKNQHGKFIRFLYEVYYTKSQYSFYTIVCAGAILKN